MITFTVNNILTHVDNAEAIHEAVGKYLVIKKDTFYKGIDYQIYNSTGRTVLRTKHRVDNTNLYNQVKHTFPTGRLGYLVDYCYENNIACQVIDQRVKPKRLFNLSFVGPECDGSDGNIPRLYQKEACAKLLARGGRGVLHHATGSGKCINKDSIISTHKGMLTFEELGSPSAKSMVDLSVKVFTPLHVHSYDKTSKLYNDGVSEDSIQITTKHGYTETGTKQHRIQAVHNGIPNWVTLPNLTSEHYAVLVKGQQQFGTSTELTEEDGYWFGLLTGDGGLTYSNRVQLTTPDSFILNFATKYLNNKNLKYSIREDPRSKGLMDLSINNKEYKQYLTNLGLHGYSYEKTVPHAIRKAPMNVVCAFIRGLFDTDGYVDKPHEPVIALSSASEVLIRQLQTILLNIGIICHYRRKKTTHRDAHIINIYRTYLNVFNNYIGFTKDSPKYNRLQKTYILSKNAREINYRDVIPISKTLLKQLTTISIAQIVGSIQPAYMVKGVNYKTVRAWYYSSRRPTRQYLLKYIQAFSELTTGYEHLVQQVRTMCSDTFVYSQVTKIETVPSHNYDFVVPVSNSFVANGFINHNTATGARIIAELGVRTLYIVPSLELLNQTVDAFSAFIKGCKIGKVGEGVWDIQPVTVAITATLWSRFETEECKQLLSNIDLILLDECHHLSVGTKGKSTKNKKGATFQVNSWYIIGINCPAYYRVGLTGTPGKDLESKRGLLESVIGRVVDKVGVKELIDSGVLSDVEIHLHTITHTCPYPDYHAARKEGVLINDAFNRYIVQIAIAELKAGESVLLLTGSKAFQGPMLVRIFEEYGYEVPFVSGDAKSKKRKKIKEDFKNGHIKCLIGTVYKEGVDFPALTVGILCDGGRDDKGTCQFLGRVLRTSKGKVMAKLHDFMHKKTKHLREHSNARLTEYVEQELDNIITHEGITL